MRFFSEMLYNYCHKVGYNFIFFSMYNNILLYFLEDYVWIDMYRVILKPKLHFSTLFWIDSLNLFSGWHWRNVAFKKKCLIPLILFTDRYICLSFPLNWLGSLETMRAMLNLEHLGFILCFIWPWNDAMALRFSSQK